MPARDPSPVGDLLRYWRTARKMSQLQLALEAEVSARHVSFLETGRARPSRDMILLLADVLDVPLRERNGLLEAGGFAAAYGETDLSAPEMKPVRQALNFILAHAEPYGCIVMDRRWNVIQMNQAISKQMLHFLGMERVASGVPINAMLAVFEPDGLRPYIVNWDEVASAMIQRLHREALGTDPRSDTRALLAQVLAFDGIPDDWRVPDLQRLQAPLVPLTMRKDDLELSLFSTIATLGTPQDVTLQELRIEHFFPADEQTDRALHRLAGLELASS